MQYSYGKFRHHVDAYDLENGVEWCIYFEVGSSVAIAVVFDDDVNTACCSRR